jgi:CRP/FNR family transcriptional regulator, cyclic AMP receptor protein
MQASNAQGRAQRERDGRPEGRPARVGAVPGMVRVLDEDPELGRYLPAGELKLASMAAVAPLHTLEPGTASFLIDEPLTHAHLGLLILGGLLARHVFFGQLGAVEFYGPGDLVRPWTRRADGAAQGRWEVLAHVRLAALDQDFATRVHAWPELAAGLLDRAAERSDAQALQSALHQTKHAEERVLLALWHFAGRWGEIGPEGRTVKLPNVTGELLARFVGARRQTVSTALGRLADSGELRRNPDGSLTLTRRPRQLEPWG